MGTRVLVWFGGTTEGTQVLATFFIEVIGQLCF